MAAPNQRVGHIRASELEWQHMEEGTRRIILGYEPQMLMMRNYFDQGVASKLHSHPHVQSSYIVSGLFEITIGTDTQQLGPGDGFLIPSGADHAARCLEPGEIIEVFTPVREDFF